MNDPANLTIEILKEIRDAVLQTNARLDQTNARLDQTSEGLNARLDQTNARLTEIAREQVRQGTAIIELQAGQRAIVDAVVTLDHRQDRVVDELRALNGRLDHVLIGPLGTTVRDHEQRIAALEQGGMARRR